MSVTHKQEHDKFPRRHDWALAHYVASVPHAYPVVWYDDPRCTGSERLPTPTAIMRWGIKYAHVLSSKAPFVAIWSTL